MTPLTHRSPTLDPPEEGQNWENLAKFLKLSHKNAIKLKIRAPAILKTPSLYFDPWTRMGTL